MMMVSSKVFHSNLSTNAILHCMSKGFSKYYKTKELCDVTIKCSVDDVALSAHKLILVSLSPFFYHALVGPLSTKDTVELPFSSTTVRCFLDCVYQHQDDTTDADIDVMEFIYLAKYLDVQVLIKYGLQIAVMQLTPENCLQTLVQITKADAQPVPEEWREIVVRYGLRRNDHHYMDDDICWKLESYVENLSPDLVCMLWSYAMETCSASMTLAFIHRLVKSYSKHNFETREGIERMEQEEFDADMKIKFESMKTQTRELQNLLIHIINRYYSGILEGFSDEGNGEIQIVHRQRVKNDDVLIQLSSTTSGHQLNFALCPKKGEFFMQEDVPRFAESLSKTYIRYGLSEKDYSAEARKNDQRKYLMWGNTLYSVNCTMESQTVMVEWERYDWVKGHWVRFRRGLHWDLDDEAEYHDTSPFKIISYLSWELVSLVLLYSRFENQICLLTGHIDGEYTIHHSLEENEPFDPHHMQMVIVSNTFLDRVRLLIFLTPLKALALPMIDAVHGRSSHIEEVEFAHPEANFQTTSSFGKIISVNNKVLHLYTPIYHGIHSEGIQVDCLDLEKRMWIRLGKICNEKKLADAHMLNEEVYLVYKKFDSDSAHFVAKCHITDDSNLQFVQESERFLADVQSDEKVERFVARKCAMPLDLL